jgi:anti-sigma factor RsiW
MDASISDLDLENYLDGRLSRARRARIKAALRRSAALRSRLEGLKNERAWIAAINDSFAICLPPEDEDRILKEGLEALRDNPPPPLDSEGLRA